jgi:hypothetical protein
LRSRNPASEAELLASWPSGGVGSTRVSKSQERADSYPFHSPGHSPERSGRHLSARSLRLDEIHARTLSQSAGDGSQTCL